MTRKNLLNRSIVFMITAMLMFVLAGCSAGQNQQNEEYVNSVKTLVNDSVNSTRDLKEQDETFNCHNETVSKEYIHSLDTLSELYQNLIKLNATADFDDLDKELSSEAALALSDISEIKSLVSYAVEQEDDTLFQRDKNKIFDDYHTHYNRLTELSSEVQTRWRNA